MDCLDKYRLVKRLVPEMDVFQATLHDERLFAIKIVQNADEAASLKRKEAWFLSQFNHERILRLEECLSFPHCFAVVTPYCNRGDLLELLSERYLTENEALYIFRQVVDGMKEIHSNRIIHRDIKPENIFLNNDGPTLNCYIGDFGYAVHEDDSEEMKRHAGTEMYAAPELLLHRPYDNKVDIWGLGATLLACLTGQTIDPTTFRVYDEWLDGLSPGMASVVKATLQFNPNMRPSAVELASILRGFVHE